MAGTSPVSTKATTKLPFLSRWEVIQREAEHLASLHLPYTNARPPSDSIGYDCSSSCAKLMQVAGYSVPYFNTATAPNYMIPGADPTGRITFWNSDINRIAGNSVHMFATISGRDWGTGDNGNPGWNPHTKAGFKPYHIDGLDEDSNIQRDASADIFKSDDQVSGGSKSLDPAQAEAASKSAAFATYLQFPGIIDTAESMALKGDRSLMNDQPLLPFVQQLATASMRRIQSMPNGNFFAFYPDYFGGMFHRTPYWNISDLEIIHGEINLSDDALATHVYTVGDIVGIWDGITEFDKAQTCGVVTMFEAFSADFITGLPERKGKAAEDKPKNLVNKDAVVSFLKKYGARAYYEEEPMIRSPYYELFLAYQKFCMMWSGQFQTTFQFTYMPELFPGGIVAFPEHGIQMWIEEVEHIFDYESGFLTNATLTAPAALRGHPNARENVHEGLLRGFQLKLEN
jgi:hypothetical protein